MASEHEHPSTVGWFRSTYSGAENACVETTRHRMHGLVPVRDSKDPDGPNLLFSPDAWTFFVGAVRSGEFTRP